MANVKNSPPVQQVDDAGSLQKQLSDMDAQRSLIAQRLDAIRTESFMAINAIADQHNFFCGVILDKNALLQVLKVALDSGDSVKIPFQLYPIS